MKDNYVAYPSPDEPFIMQEQEVPNYSQSMADESVAVENGLQSVAKFPEGEAPTIVEDGSVWPQVEQNLGDYGQEHQDWGNYQPAEDQ